MLGFARTAAWNVLIGCTLMLFAGCGGDGDGFTGPRGQVTGKVTFEGELVPEGSTVVFQTLEGKSYFASGVVQADGSYELLYDGQNEMPAVKYFIQVTPPAGAGSGPVDPTKMDSTIMNVKPSKKPAKTDNSVFPAKYSAALTSGLSYEVNEGLNTHDIELTK